MCEEQLVKNIGKDVIEENKRIYGKEVLDYYLIEEMSELTKEVTKKLRGDLTREHLVSEIADVYYTLSMFIQENGIEVEDLNERIDYKQKRARQVMRTRVNRQIENKEESYVQT